MGRWRERLVWLGLAAAVVAALAYGFWPRPIDVDLASVARGDLLVEVSEDGKTRVREKFVVSAPVTGQLLRLNLHSGDSIEQGKTVLAVIQPNDPALLDAREMAEAEGRVHAASAAEKQAETQLDRATEAHGLAIHDLTRARQVKESRAITREQFDQAEHKERLAEAEVRAAEFAVKVASFELAVAEAALIRAKPFSGDPTVNGQFLILAPVNGRVLRVFRESAGPVASGTQLLEVGDLTNLELEVDVLSSDAVGIRPGATARIEHWGGGQPLSARVRLVEPAAFLKISALGVEEQRVNVIADFTAPLDQRPTLGDAYRVEARIQVSRVENVAKVPAGALFRRQGDWHVFEVQNGRARLRPVTIGLTNGLETEIRSGLEVGGAVVIYPTDRIQDGTAVQAR